MEAVKEEAFVITCMSNHFPNLLKRICSFECISNIRNTKIKTNKEVKKMIEDEIEEEEKGMIETIEATTGGEIGVIVGIVETETEIEEIEVIEVIEIDIEMMIKIVKKRKNIKIVLDPEISDRNLAKTRKNRVKRRRDNRNKIVTLCKEET
jgi:hypothetical protein